MVDLFPLVLVLVVWGLVVSLALHRIANFLEKIWKRMR